MQNNTVRRIRLVMLAFVIAFGSIVVRLSYLGSQSGLQVEASFTPTPSNARPDILDRNGNVLAIDIPSFSVFAEPRRIIDLDEAIEGLSSVFLDLDTKDLRRRLSSGGGFTWVRRHVSPTQVDQVWAQGIPGVAVRRETRRLYPNGPSGAHVLGAVNVDNNSISGIERWIDDNGLSALKAVGLPLASDEMKAIGLSLDLRVQYAVEDELRASV